MTNKIFLEIGMAIQQKFRFIPILFGDFALERRLGIDLNTKQMQFLIPCQYLDKHWHRLYKVMTTRSFELIDEEKHSFSREGIIVEFSSIENFKDRTGFSTKKLLRFNDPISFYLPDLRQFLFCYRLMLEESNSVEERTKLLRFIELTERALRSETIKNTRAFLKSISEKKLLMSDYTHYVRVAENCKKLCNDFNANEYVCVLSALLFDIEDVKMDDTGKKYSIAKLLKNEFVNEQEMKAIINAIAEVKSPKRCRTNEGKCLSDAYNLDYLGAVGIAMGFYECAKLGVAMYPLDSLNITIESSERRDCRDAFEHFKFIKDNYKKRFYSEQAKEIAIDRMDYMQSFLYRFYDEMEGTS